MRALTVLGWLWKGDISSITSAPSGIWNGLYHSLLLRICRAYYFLEIGQADEALRLVERKNPPLEIYLIKPDISLKRKSL